MNLVPVIAGRGRLHLLTADRRRGLRAATAEDAHGGAGLDGGVGRPAQEWIDPTGTPKRLTGAVGDVAPVRGDPDSFDQRSPGPAVRVGAALRPGRSPLDADDGDLWSGTAGSGVRPAGGLTGRRRSKIG